MGIEDYKKRVTPAKRRSRLEPYTKEILAMVAEGYSLKQIAAGLWLEYQVKIGTTALWEFIGRRSKLSSDDLEKPITAKVTAPGPTAPASESASKAPPSPPLAEALDAEKRAERAKSYVADTNPLFGRKKK